MPSISEDSSNASTGVPAADVVLARTAMGRSKVSGFFTSFDDNAGLPWNRSWGIFQIGVGVVVVLVAAVLGVSFGAAVAGPDALEEYRLGTASPGLIVVSSLGAFQLAMVLWPFVVTKVWNGGGMARDWGLRLKLADLSTGLTAALVALVCVPLMAGLMSWLIDLEDRSEAGNTDFLTEAEGTPWLYALIFGSVIGAPVAEELFFRGFIQRSLERFGGRIVGVLGSTVCFALPHFTGAALKPTIVLLVSISVVGLVFGAVAAITRRLGPTIIAHIIFNGVVVAYTVLG